MIKNWNSFVSWHPFLLFEKKKNATGDQRKYRTAYACEGSMLTLSCSENNEVINLLRANYGRFSITICNEHGDTDWSVNCMSHRSLRALHSKWVGSLFISFLFFFYLIWFFKCFDAFCCSFPIWWREREEKKNAVKRQPWPRKRENRFFCACVCVCEWLWLRRRESCWVLRPSSFFFFPFAPRGETCWRGGGGERKRKRGRMMIIKKRKKKQKKNLLRAKLSWHGSQI